MKVALVHDWLIHMRGGERVLESLAEIFPDATIYTLFHRWKRLSPPLKRMKIKTSFLHYLPGIRKYYRWLLPLLPFVIRSLKLEEDVSLVISSSHCVAKGVRIPQGACHVCYCHTPMRYLWGFQDEYFRSYPFWLREMIKMFLSRLRRWDFQTSESVQHFMCNSENVKTRIREYYERDAAVIYPPLDAEHFYPMISGARDYYLVVSAFVPYKRVDLVIEAFNQLDKKLVVVGAGPLAGAYYRLRKSEKIFFLGSVSDASLRELYAGAQALIFPTYEDFGIVPLEAQACGTPVIAYRRGGALESVRHGVFFEEQTPESIQKAVLEFETREFDRRQIAKSVIEFDKDHFRKKMKKFLREVTGEKIDGAVAEA